MARKTGNNQRGKQGSGRGKGTAGWPSKNHRKSSGKGRENAAPKKGK